MPLICIISSFAVSFSKINVYGYCEGRLAAAERVRLVADELIEPANVVLAAVEL